jgi:hypothetical protein
LHRVTAILSFTAAVYLALAAVGVPAMSSDSSDEESSQSVETRDTLTGDAAEVVAKRTQKAPGQAADPKPVAQGTPAPPPPPPENVVYEPSWGTHPETGEDCIQLTRFVRENVANTRLATDFEHRTLTMLGDQRLRDVEHLFCRGGGDEDGPGPGLLAETTIRRIGIPSPEPQIDPGWAMTGMPAYLEIHGQEAFTHEEAIPGFGRLRVAFEPTYFEVDWGDGTTTTVEDGRTGAPYNGPENQQISHTYADVSDSNVVHVEARWHATWDLGGFRGVVGGLQTSEEFPLEVREMQTVRTSSR